MKVLDDEQAANAVEQGVFICWMELDSISVLSVVANRVFHLKKILLSFLWGLWMLNLPTNLSLLLLTEDATLKIVLFR